jgi:hypothetical protein
MDLTGTDSKKGVADIESNLSDEEISDSLPDTIESELVFHEELYMTSPDPAFPRKLNGGHREYLYPEVKRNICNGRPDISCFIRKCT